MSRIQNLTVTNDRLRKALGNALSASAGGVASESVSKGNGEEDALTLIQATVTKWYSGTGKISANIDNQEITADLNYPFCSNDLFIGIIPDGSTSTDKDGLTYIRPSTTITANILRQGDTYLCLGFLRANTKTPDQNEILLQAGDNMITISPDFISINTPALYINGEHYEGH